MLSPGVVPTAVALWWVVSEGLGSGSQLQGCPGSLGSAPRCQVSPGFLRGGSRNSFHGSRSARPKISYSLSSKLCVVSLPALSIKADRRARPDSRGGDASSS